MAGSKKEDKVVSAILRWYAHHGRKLPWRLSDEQKRVNAYHILVSEIMLQQTQVSRVLVKYPLFLKQFPTLRALASARQRDVVMAWRGMGYNNRAVRLHKLARTVITEYGGQLPQKYDTLIRLPGIGRYTANALLSALGKHVPVVDVNIQRVLSRIFWRMPSIQHMQSLDKVWDLAAALLQQHRSYHWNQALMDLGATVCTAKKPRCAVCSIASHCASRSAMTRKVVFQLKREPSINGIPNRIYRGQLVEILRRNAGGRTAEQLGMQLLRSRSNRHARWLRALLQGLQRDGIVKIRGNGSLKTQSVSLA